MDLGKKESSWRLGRKKQERFHLRMIMRFFFGKSEGEGNNYNFFVHQLSYQKRVDYAIILHFYSSTDFRAGKWRSNYFNLINQLIWLVAKLVELNFFIFWRPRIYYANYSRRSFASRKRVRWYCVTVCPDRLLEATFCF